MFRLMFSVFLAFSTPLFAEESEHTISVTGVGTVTATPDIAEVNLGVTHDARTANEALFRTSEAMREVLEILVKEGVLETDIQTRDLSLFPSFENRTPGRPPTVIGYRAQNTVAIKIRNIDNLGEILDGVSHAGSNLIQSIQFGLDDSESLMNEARKAAILNARERAELYAQSAGIAVGQVISISESGGFSPSPRTMARAQMEAMSMDVPVAQGELALRATVHVVYLIE